MAGERYATLTIRAGWSWHERARGLQADQVRLRLGGQWVTFRRGGNPANNEFEVPDPAQPVPRDFVRAAVQNLLSLVRAAIAQRGLSYAVSAIRDVGENSSHVGQYYAQDLEDNPWPLVEFDLTALVYDGSLDLDFVDDSPAAGFGWNGWTVVQNLRTVSPVLVTPTVTNAGIYGSATGRIELLVNNNQTGNFTYQWDDEVGLGIGVRASVIGPRTYGCLVTADTGASTYVSVFVGADPRLEVVAVTTDTSITLHITGGLPPYVVQWADGPTSVARTGLPPAVYRALVTDSRGAQQQVVVDLARPPYHWSRNPVVLALDAGDDYRADPTTKPNLSFLCEVWVELDYLSGSFVQVGTTLEQPADRQGRTSFQVQALLDAYLQPHVPAPGATTPVRAESLFKRFYLRHAEQFGTPPVPSAATSLDYRYVVQGGLNFYEASARTWFSHYQLEKLPFLTWEPTPKYVLDDQPEYVYYMVRKRPDAFQARLRVGFSTGQTQEVPLWQVVTDPCEAEVYCLPVGYQALGLAGFAGLGLALTWWEVWVATPDGQTVLSETRRYYREARRFPHRRYFLFQTSLGGMATYAALGQAQLEAEVTGAEAARTLTPDYDPQLGDVQVQERLLRPVVKVASGVRTAAQLRASQDLLLSRRVLLLSGQRWQPGFVKAKTVTLLDEGKLVQVQEFEFTQPTERLYTPDL